MNRREITPAVTLAARSLDAAMAVIVLTVIVVPVVAMMAVVPVPVAASVVDAVTILTILIVTTVTTLTALVTVATPTTAMPVMALLALLDLLARQLVHLPAALNVDPVVLQHAFHSRPDRAAPVASVAAAGLGLVDRLLDLLHQIRDLRLLHARGFEGRGHGFDKALAPRAARPRLRPLRHRRR